jgi:hypothetical protein
VGGIAEGEPWLTLRELIQQHPRLHPPVVDGLFRAGETVNIIAHSKVGKSWLAYNLALSVITGRKWLDTFPTAKGRVLLVDNELHRETLANRIPTVAEAMGIDLGDCLDDLVVWPLRGRLRPLEEVAARFNAVTHGEYRIIILDAKYRFIGEGASENDNAAETRFYNLIDSIAERTGAAVVLVHHASKGSQGDRRTTDIGSGAGAQSRAADCHLVLREHEQQGVAILDGAVRSFPPMDPLPVRWDYPLWSPAPDADAELVKGRRITKDPEKRLDEDAGKVFDAMVKMKAREPRQTMSVIAGWASMCGKRCKAALLRLEVNGHVRRAKMMKRNRLEDAWELADEEVEKKSLAQSA